jgi:hypothetical protein
LSFSSLCYAEDAENGENGADAGMTDNVDALNPPPSLNAIPEAAEQEVAPPDYERALTWNELTRLAREHRQLGELDLARERLAQAAFLVRPLPPTNAQRKTVFGMQARLAIDLADSGEITAADDLTSELFAEAEAEPELGGAALASLAVSVADRRPPESQLSILRIAFKAAEAGSASRDRLGLTFRVADEAYRGKDFDLARRAIDLALSDAQHIGPSKKERIASLELYKSRVALAQGDLEAAEMSAITANRIFEEVSASSSQRGAGEAALAEILAHRGVTQKALAIARGAHARIDGEEPLDDHSKRVILASLARVERSVGESASARIHFEEALAIPAADFPWDLDLVDQLTIELQELETAGTN